MIDEIFKSISGETGLIPQGSMCTFIRLAGCNLRCSYCDAKRSWDAGSPTEIDDIMHLVRTRYVVITGGEPLLQSSQLQVLILALQMKGCLVQLETNGTMSIDAVTPHCYVVDFKLPSSGNPGKLYDFIDNVIKKRPDHHVVFIKFVVSNDEDIEYAMGVRNKITEVNNGDPLLWAWSPCGDKITPSYLYDQMKKYKLTEDILNLQLHKIVGLA